MELSIILITTKREINSVNEHSSLYHFTFTCQLGLSRVFVFTIWWWIHYLYIPHDIHWGILRDFIIINSNFVWGSFNCSTDYWHCPVPVTHSLHCFNIVPKSFFYCTPIVNYLINFNSFVVLVSLNKLKMPIEEIYSIFFRAQFGMKIPSWNVP